MVLWKLIVLIHVCVLTLDRQFKNHMVFSFTILFFITDLLFAELTNYNAVIQKICID